MSDTTAGCPACGTRLHDLWEYGGEGEYEIECGHCDAPLTLSVRVSVDYELEKREEAKR